MIGQQSNLLIVDVDSAEELTRMIDEEPLFFYCKGEVYPLTTREAQKKYLKWLIGA